MYGKDAIPCKYDMVIMCARLPQAHPHSAIGMENARKKHRAHAAKKRSFPATARRAAQQRPSLLRLVPPAADARNGFNPPVPARARMPA